MFRKSVFLLAIPLAVLFVSCQSNQQNEMAAKYKDDYRAVANMMDNGNVDGLDAYIAEDAVEHQVDSSITTKTGLEGIKDIFRFYHKLFPDLKTTIHSIAVSGDTLFAFITQNGTTSEPFMGMPAGQHTTMNSVDLIVFKDNKMQEHWSFIDSNDVKNMMKMMQEKSAMEMKKK
jgi:predicted ester cyclase